MGKKMGVWVSSRRCQVCNSVSLLKKFEETGKRKKFEDKGIIEEDGKIVECPAFCDNGWYRSKGTLSKT